MTKNALLKRWQKFWAGPSPSFGQNPKEQQFFFGNPSLICGSPQGDKDKKLAKLDQWPETEVINDETQKLAAAETIWRDLFDGQRLENWTWASLRGSSESCT